MTCSCKCVRSPQLGVATPGYPAIDTWSPWSKITPNPEEPEQLEDYEEDAWDVDEEDEYLSLNQQRNALEFLKLILDYNKHILSSDEDSDSLLEDSFERAVSWAKKLSD